MCDLYKPFSDLLSIDSLLLMGTTPFKGFALRRSLPQFISWDWLLDTVLHNPFKVQTLQIRKVNLIMDLEIR